MKRHQRTSVFVTNQPGGTAQHGPPGAALWPIVRAYVPQRDAWLASGVGTAGIIRERPDGRWASAYFTFSVLEGGVIVVFGKDETTPAANDELLESSTEHIPPFEPGPPELAAAFIRGALAFGAEQGHLFPPRELAPRLALVPPLPGSLHERSQRFIGEGGLAPPGLWAVARRFLKEQERSPPGKEVLIRTCLTFDLPPEVNVNAALAARRPEFERTSTIEGKKVFQWSRPAPAAPSAPPQRQLLGRLYLAPDALLADVPVLSRAALLTMRLRELLGDGLRLRAAAYHPYDEPEPPALWDLWRPPQG